MAGDMDLVREYARNNSEDAFASLVSRHINLVYSVALRRVRDAHLAEEITQVVFIILARKAGSLSPKTILSGWLCRTARYVSARALTTQQRRLVREQEVYMQSALNEPESEPRSAVWAEIAPELDLALAQLAAKDHDAVVLRFFDGKSLRDVGAALGTSEDGARVRVHRALNKLQKYFTKKGIALSTAVIAGAVAANSVQAAPAALTKSVTAAALVKGATVSVSTLTLIKGGLKVMAWTKAKTAVVVGVIALFGAATVPAVIHYQAIKGTVAFDGRRWFGWRTMFEIRGDKLVTLPRSSPHFNYGVNGSGRGAELLTGIGDPALKDYRATFEFCATGTDPTFNPYGVDLNYHDGTILFHVADAGQTWNTPGNSLYKLEVRGSGEWLLASTYNEYCDVPTGFGNIHKEGGSTLAEGQGLNLDRQNGNKYVIEVRGPRIQVWVDGQQIVDVTDDKMSEHIGRHALDHGGIGFTWGYETMGWIRNFSLQPL